MKLEGKTLIVAFIIAVLTFVIVSFWAAQDEQPNYVREMADCYQKQMQCGIHIIIEDSEYEDPSLELVEEWLVDNTHDVPTADRKVGLRIVRHLMTLSYEERAKLVNKALELNAKRNMP